ncbi:hypothetical protein ABPG72_015710 [Tetrahymena utriculariae]
MFVSLTYRKYFSDCMVAVSLYSEISLHFFLDQKLRDVEYDGHQRALNLKKKYQNRELIGHTKLILISDLANYQGSNNIFIQMYLHQKEFIQVFDDVIHILNFPIQVIFPNTD